MRLREICKYVRYELKNKPWYLIKLVYVAEHYMRGREKIVATIHVNNSILAMNSESCGQAWYKAIARETTTLRELLNILPAYGEK